MTDSTPTRLRGDLWAILSALATASGLIAAKFALQSMTALTFNSYMFFMGAIIVLIDAALSRTLRETVFISVRQLGFLFIVAVLFCGGTFCLFTAVSLAEPATVSFLSRLELAATLILATIFLKERINPAEFAGLIFVVAGIFVMRYNASIELSHAVTLVTVGSLLTGGGETLIKSKISWINYRSFMLYRNLFMSAIFLIVGSASGRLVWIADGRLIIILVIAAFLLPYMGRMSYLKAMQNINISRASIIGQSQPFFAVVGALAILGTLPTVREIGGGILIVTGVLVIKLIERHSARRKVMSGPAV
jgi:drug/metabolite transporter (DMT)-like permease